MDNCNKMEIQNNIMEIFDHINASNNTDYINICIDKMENNDSLKKRILRVIQRRSASYGSNLHQIAIAYSNSHFQHSYVSPLNFIMFNKPPEAEGLGVLWSYRRILVQANELISVMTSNTAIQRMKQYIGNLVGNRGPMAEVFLNRIISGPKPPWEPVKQNLNDLIRIVAGMNRPPLPIHSTPREEFELEIVTLTLLSNLAVLMNELNKVATSQINARSCIDLNEEKDCSQKSNFVLKLN